MLSAIIWGALSTLSFALFFTLPSGSSGPNYYVLVPGLIALAASIHRLTQMRDQPTRRFAMSAPAAFDDSLVEQAEKLRRDKWDEQNNMLRHQSSRRRAASANSRSRKTRT